MENGPKVVPTPPSLQRNSTHYLLLNLSGQWDSSQMSQQARGLLWQRKGGLQLPPNYPRTSVETTFIVIEK